MLNNITDNPIRDLIEEFNILEQNTIYFKLFHIYKGNTNIGYDILNRFPNITVSVDPIPVGVWKPVSCLNEHEMLRSAQKMPLSNAIKKMTELHRLGIFDTMSEPSYRIIFLEELDENGNEMKLFCGRESSGDIFMCAYGVRNVIWSKETTEWYTKSKPLD